MSVGLILSLVEHNSRQQTFHCLIRIIARDSLVVADIGWQGRH